MYGKGCNGTYQTPTLKAAGSNPVGRTKSIPDLLFGMLFIIKNISLSLGES